MRLISAESGVQFPPSLPKNQGEAIASPFYILPRILRSVLLRFVKTIIISLPNKTTQKNTKTFSGLFLWLWCSSQQILSHLYSLSPDSEGYFRNNSVHKGPLLVYKSYMCILSLVVRIFPPCV